MDAERLAITRRVMKAMRHESARKPLRELNADGGRQLVICLPSDTLDYVVGRVTATGGRATVVVPYGDSLVTLGWVMQASTEALFDGDSVLHPNSTVGLLVDYLYASGQGRLSFHLSHGDVDVVGGDRITVPA